MAFDDAAHFTCLGRTETLPIPKIDFGAPGARPEHQLWYMNLHYMEYLEEVQDRLWAELVEAWIETNPPGRRHAPDTAGAFRRS